MESERSVATTDGLTLAVYETGDPSRQTVVLVHGYPDDHHVWDGVAAILADRFHVVAYDVRGCGASEAPTSRKGYTIPQLVADLGAVIEATAPGERVHLVAHDWGSIQSWDALTDSVLSKRLLSYTSISGPSLDMAGRWLRGARHPLASLRQVRDSWYVFAFQVPKLPELLVRNGLLTRIVDHSKAKGDHARPHGRAVSHRDAINGLELYRANFLARMITPVTAQTTVPVQVIAPIDDAHVTVPLQTEAPLPYVQELCAVVVPGNHWVVEQDPELIAGHITDFIGALQPA